MNKIESIRIRGFRSLADVELKNLPNVSVMIGPNGSGKSNLIRFFEMMSWMLRSRRLNDFVQERGGGADDQLFQGRRVTPLIEAAVTIGTEVGRNEYRFTLVWAQPDRLIFTDESFRFSSDGTNTQADWQSLDSGHGESRLVEAAQRQAPERNLTTAKTILHLLRNCAVYQFHDTSHDSRFKQKWDVENCSQLRSDGGNLAPVLLRLEREDVRRYELNLPADYAGAADLRPLRYRRRAWESLAPLACERFRQDHRCTFDLGRVAALLCPRHSAQSSFRNVARCAAHRRTGIGVASGSGRAYRSDDSSASVRSAKLLSQLNLRCWWTCLTWTR